ncbi:hypothetical protein ACMFMF_000022 [Clarireedia jacksonii]
MIITSDDHGPLANVIMWMILPLMIIVVGAKIYTKWDSVGRLQNDDWWMVVSMLLAIGQSVATTAEVHYGLGRNQDSLTENQLNTFFLSEYIAELLYAMTIFVAKLIAFQFYIVLANPHSQKHIIKAHIYGTLLWVFIIIFIISFQCHPPHIWLEDSGRCINKV